MVNVAVSLTPKMSIIFHHLLTLNRDYLNGAENEMP